MNLYRLTFAGILMLAVNHCWAGQESLIDLQFELINENISPKGANPLSGAPAEVKIAPRSSNCSVIINPPNDVRRNKDTLGATFRDNPIISKPPVTDWLKDALLNMNKEGVNTSLTTASDYTPSPDVAYLTVDLEKVYLWFHGMNIHGTIVVNTKTQIGNNSAIQHHYRVISSKSNWASTDSEYVTTLNMAASRLIKQIAGDIEKQCQVKTASTE